MLGSGVKVTRDHGIVAAPQLALRVSLTLHPSFLLRVNPERKDAEVAPFVADLKRAGES